MKARQKAQARWSANKRRPAYKKIAGSAYWIDEDRKPRVPGGGPRRSSGHQHGKKDDQQPDQKPKV